MVHSQILKPPRQAGCAASENIIDVCNLIKMETVPFQPAVTAAHGPILTGRSNAGTIFACVTAGASVSLDQLFAQVVDHPAVFHLGTKQNHFSITSHPDGMPGRPVKKVAARNCLFVLI